MRHIQLIILLSGAIFTAFIAEIAVANPATGIVSHCDAKVATVDLCAGMVEKSSLDNPSSRARTAGSFVASLRMTAHDDGEPVIRFQSRNPGIDPATGNSSNGHAFILLGRQSEQGEIDFFSIYGFYEKPLDAQPQEVYAILNAPSTMDLNLNDLSSDQFYQANLSDQQMAVVEDILDHRNLLKQASLAASYIAVAAAVGSSLGLNYSSDSLPGWLNGSTRPGVIIQDFISKNNADGPIEFLQRDLARQLTSVTALQQEIMKAFPHGPIQYPQPGPPGAEPIGNGGTGNGGNTGGQFSIVHDDDGTWKACLPYKILCS